MHLDEWVDREARLAKPREHLVLAVQLQAIGRAHRVEPCAEGALGGEPRVELPQAAGRGVAGVGEGGLALGGAGLVELREGLERQVHLAAHLHARGRRADARAHHQGHGLDGADVAGDVLPHLAVPARGAGDQLAVLVRERHRQAVDLGLHHVVHLLAGHALLVEHRLQAAVPLTQLVLTTGVGQAEHGLQVPVRLESLRWLRAHALGGGIGGDQFGVRRLQGLELAHPLVVHRIVHRRVVQHVVPVRCIADETAQLRRPRDGGLGRAQGASPFPGAAPAAEAMPGNR